MNTNKYLEQYIRSINDQRNGKKRVSKHKEVKPDEQHESKTNELLSAYVEVPVDMAKLIANQCEKDQVIIVCWDKHHGKSHVTTYGKTMIDCEQAAMGGNKVKKAIGWPDELCHAKPERR